jgi:Helicase conserved C-terminal domain
VSIHGGKEQSDRNEAIQLFKDGKKDVLIATDIAAKVCTEHYSCYHSTPPVNYDAAHAHCNAHNW